MNKLQSFALYTLFAPAITFSSAAVLAQQSTGQDIDNEQQASQQQPGGAQSGQGTLVTGQSESQTATGQRSTGEQSRMENRGYMDAAPTNGLHASNLIGAEVKTADDEDVGSVSDLIIDEDGQIVAIVVGVGGFLGMGEKDVAIGWDDVTKSRTSDDNELRVSLTREGLRSAPEFKRAD